MIQIVKATIADIELLATMNKLLIEDEQHDNLMNIEELKQRMKEFLLNEYIAYLFHDGNATKGYALVNIERKPMYLRQFFISRNSRNSGFGRCCFQLLIEELDVNKLDVEVMYKNEAGYKFWKALGFEERSVYLSFEK